MNIKFKPFKAKENHPYLVEAPNQSVPFREEDVEEINFQCWYLDFCLNNWNPDSDKIYSIDGKYEIYEYPLMKVSWETEEMFQDRLKNGKRIKFAVLLKEETVKSNQNVCWNCKRLLNKNKWHCECGVANEGTEKVESQDELWNELSKLWGAYPDKNNPRWEQIKSKFHISRIKHE